MNAVVLDGINNPGFSGGPIFHCGLGQTEPSLFGVVNGYRFEQYSQGQVFKKVGENFEPIEDTYVKRNSGIIYAASSEVANTMISLLKNGLRIGQHNK